jgi:hypothetical protein
MRRRTLSLVTPARIGHRWRVEDDPRHHATDRERSRHSLLPPRPFDYAKAVPRFAIQRPTFDL